MRGAAMWRRLLLEILADELTEPRIVVDLGGGTGGLAATLAGQGHRVSVVDPSPDSLAAVERRAAEAGLQDRLTARQGDASTLSTELPAGSVDLILCHDVLEFVDSAEAAVHSIAQVLRPGGTLSLLTAQRYPRAITHAAAGDFAGAQQVFTDQRLPDPARAQALLTDAGLQIRARHGLGLAAGQLSEDSVESRPDDVLALERLLAADPALLPAAPRLHLVAVR
ncbi:class I SAM-dependent methyltransferase [Naumannella halotolerans]|uniref:Methyltransferase family protein n=1 Tax=Naumannella halotolerans TaxID=993414 RepID=A0A4R7J8E4_9ACTN|nr:class I SAM-dependent methyltransferase [Naumannella halotolerans]TDT32797.1 methyltransferase family protein [Naumannella halotolerans]